MYDATRLAREDLFGVGLTRSAKIKQSFLGGVKFGAFGAVSDIALIGLQAKRAGRGGFTSAIIGQSTASVIGIPIAGFAAAAVSLIPGVGPFAAALIGETFALSAEYRIGASITDKVRLFTDLNRRVRHLEMGGDYKDTVTAQRQRLRAIQDMNASLIPGRRFLGQEALLMHR
jgi:hypothetical protein